MELTERLQLLSKKMAKSERDFAITVGINQPTWHNYVTGKRAPSFDCIMAILTAFPDVSSEWLLRGEGEMVRTPTMVVNNDNRRTIARGDHSIAASDGATVTTTDHAELIAICKQLLADPSVDKNKVLDVISRLIV